MNFFKMRVSSTNLFARLRKKREDKYLLALVRNDGIRKHELLAVEYYRNVMENIDMNLCRSSKEEYLSFIEYTMEVIRNELKYDSFADIIYRKGTKVREPYSHFIPSHYYDEDDEYICDVETVYSDDYEISLADDIVISIPWDLNRMTAASSTGKRVPFRYHRSNIRANYYKELGVCYVWNGLHHVAAGAVNRQGSIMAKAYSIAHLFPHVDTDGYRWLNSHNGNPLDVPYNDYRINILYGLAKKKWSSLQDRHEASIIEPQVHDNVYHDRYKKCSRCGRTFDYYLDFEEREYSKEFKPSFFLNHYFKEYDEDNLLCNECLSSLDKWFAMTSSK